MSEADDYIEEREGGRLVIFQRNGIFQARVYRGERSYLYRSLKIRVVKGRLRSLNARGIGERIVPEDLHLNKYLARIGVHGTPKANLATLSAMPVEDIFNRIGRSA